MNLSNFYVLKSTHCGSISSITLTCIQFVPIHNSLGIHFYRVNAINDDAHPLQMSCHTKKILSLFRGTLEIIHS